MWTMILLAVHVNNPQDVPGRIELTFPSQAVCEQTLDTLKYQINFRQFKVEGQCVKNETK
jgi:hypothetical protein